MSFHYEVPIGEWDTGTGDLFENCGSVEYGPGGSFSVEGMPFGVPIVMLTGSFGGGGGSYYKSPSHRDHHIDLYPLIVEWANPEVFGRFSPQATFSGQLVARIMATPRDLYIDTDFVLQIDNIVPEPASLCLVVPAALLLAALRHRLTV